MCKTSDHDKPDCTLSRQCNVCNWYNPIGSRAACSGPSHAEKWEAQKGSKRLSTPVAAAASISASASAPSAELVALEKLTASLTLIDSRMTQADARTTRIEHGLVALNGRLEDDVNSQLDSIASSRTR
jgi:hypothetical protein